MAEQARQALTRNALALRLGCPNWATLCLRFGHHLAMTAWEDALLLEDVRAMVACPAEPASAPRHRYPAIRAVRPEDSTYHPVRGLCEYEAVPDS